MVPHTREKKSCSFGNLWKIQKYNFFEAEVAEKTKAHLGLSETYSHCTRLVWNNLRATHLGENKIILELTTYLSET